MALKNRPAQTSNTAAFEAEPGTEQTTAVAETSNSSPAAAAPQEQPRDAGAAATTAIATASATSRSVATNDAITKAKSFKKEVEAMFGAADMSYGSHRVFKAKDGVIKEMQGDKLKLGRWVKVHLLAWDRHFEVSPGEEGEASSSFVGYSKDGVTIDSVIGEDVKAWEGKPVQEYLEYLRTEEDFDKASKREFIDCEVAVLGSEEEPDFHEIVQVTLSSSSIPSFKRYQSDLEAKAKCVAMNLPGFSLPESPFEFYFIREDAEKGRNTWTKLKIASTLPVKI